MLPDSRCVLVWILILTGSIGGLPVPCAVAESLTGELLRRRLEERIERNPLDAAAWRLLGRVLLEAGELESALEALQTSVECSPDSAAAHLDLGRALQRAKRPQAAAAHLRQVLVLAPGTSYQAEAESLLAEHSVESRVEQTGYEVRQFTGSETPDRVEFSERGLWTEPNDLLVRLDFGASYNTNVALAPTSRELAPDRLASAQGFFSPQLELRLLNNDVWRAGPTFRGDFNVNEAPFRSFNLQSYQPGAFIERTISPDAIDGVVVPRLQYDFTHDAFDGETFANRHAVLLSGTALWDEGGTSLGYVGFDHTNFLDDGVLPEVTSRDGWTTTLGASHRFLIDSRWVTAFRGGLELMRAETVGTDFTFQSIALNGDIEVPLWDRASLVLRGGWAFRDYFRYEFTPSRDEHVWQAGAELRQQLTAQVALIGFIAYDRFDSENPLFATHRTLTGMLLRYEF